MTGSIALSGPVLILVSVAVIIAATAIIAWIAGWVVGRLVRLASPPMGRAGRQLTVGVIAVIGTTLVLQQIGVNVDIVLLIVGLVGATALIALREPLGHYGARYFANIYTPFKVGDTISVQGVSGKVIGINMMCTVLLSDDDHLISVPNETIVREIVINTSPQAWKEVAIPVTLGGSVDLPAFESDLLKSLSKLRTRLDPQFPPVLTTKARTPQSTELVLTLMLRRPEDRDTITREANKRLSETLDRGAASRPRSNAPPPAPAPSGEAGRTPPPA